MSPAEFRELFTAERDRLHRFLHRLCRHAADAEDLLQEAFLAAWRKRDQYEGRGSAEGWMRRIAWTTYLNARAKRCRRDALAPPAAPPATEGPVADGVADREVVRLVTARVRALLSTLPDGPREAFVMFRFEGLRVAEIAELTGVPPKTVETRIRRAAGLLHDALQPWKHHLPTP